MVCFYVRPAMVLILLGLAACGGGGGGGGGSVSTPPPITNLPENATTKLDGQGISAAYQPGSLTPLPAGEASTTLTIRDGQVVAVSLDTPETNIAFDVNNGDSIAQNDLAVVATARNGDAELALANGYQHQTFGVWIEGSPSGSGRVGAGSFGNKTTTLPTGGATYRGTSAGYLQQGTSRYVTSSNIEIETTDFKGVTINSTGTEAVSLTAGELPNATDYNFNGSGSVVREAFQARIDAGNGVSGSADGQFYGPTAEEVGGTFALQGLNGQQYFGAFGARQ